MLSVGTNGSSNPVQYRIQKGDKRSGSIVDPQAIARAFDVNGRYAMLKDSSTANESSDSQSFYNNVGLYTTNMPGALDLQFTHSLPQSQQSRPGFLSVSPSDAITNGETSLQDWNAYHAGMLISPVGKDVYKKGVQNIGASSHSLGESTRPSCCQPARSTEDDSVIEQADTRTKAGTTNAMQERNAVCLHKGHVLPPFASHDQNMGISKAAGYKTDAQLPTSNAGMCSTYSIPSSYTTANHLLNPKQPLGHQQISPGISQPEPQCAYPLSGSAALSTGESLVQSPAHNCNCGDDCNCLGCAAHPYNATTRNHVEDLSRILADGYRGRPSHSPETTQDNADSTANKDGVSNYVVPVSSHISSPILASEFDTTRISNHDEEFSTASAFLEQNQSLDSMFSSRDFYTMEFPLESTGAPYYGCSDVSGTCMCGDDCTCIGCLTHSGHNGEPPLIESPYTETHLKERLNEPD